jgi:flagellar biosynthetic protein FliR
MNEAQLMAYMWLLACVAVRVSSLFLFFPFFSSMRIPFMVKAAACFLFSIALLEKAKTSFPVEIIQMKASAGFLIFFVIRELLVGAGMGLIAKAFYDCCIASAEWIGLQMGFNMSAMMDPMGDQHQSSWAIFHDWLAMMVYLSLGGQWWSLRAIADSYQINTESIFQMLADSSRASALWIQVGQQFFFWMVKLAGPMLAVVMFLQFSMGILSKFIPQINLWTVSVPLTLGIGIFAFSVFSPMYGDILGSLFSAQKDGIEMWLRFLGR